ncbi:MAG: trypsin-like peptidase domain-containing protein [Gemmatimonadota bacterium]|nr:trypsin-like peptidase domain-containing protein [Gemmatimonadota bacterium]MDH3367547.1 trypsin-like peptidase domain-containing protein [Gemmatimonadota bacterium]MDH3477278.1 trypsin-like peptidase domain-containing protein [Gemmatimonadota bacterium]MDH3569356.1 trypsin-like peptidase domain-containing protein [Gemmatimonadota bacterium]MDH5548653.1 trypsin-like peptidase domain-containing protein [Gemmatimonadota bacterium]
MKPQLRILSGARTGHTEVFSKPSIAVGRHPSCDLCLDAERDLTVSAHHAVILRKGDRWYVRDTESSNGTLINGHRIIADTALSDTDQIGLGVGGPVIEVRLVADRTADGIVREAANPPTDVAPTGPIRTTDHVPRPRESASAEIRAVVGQQTRKLRATIGVLLIALVAVAALSLYQSRRLVQRQVADAAAMQAHTDSVLATADRTVAALRGQVEGMAARLRASQGEVQQLQQDLNAAYRRGQSDDVRTLTQRLEAATRNLQYQQAAAQVDYAAIAERNQRAVAILWVEFGPNEVQTGTAFAVRRDGVLITNRHVVAGPTGTRRPTRVAVRFADSDQTWRARVLAVSDDADLAAIKVDIRGGVPSVQRINPRADTLPQGAPVAVIGFPLGTSLPMTGEIVRTTLLAGTVSKSLSNVLQIDGYGAAGSSGSPVFDGNGDVVAVLYGGDATNGRIVFGVPGNAVARLLGSLN